MFFKERRQDLSTKMQHMGYTKFQRNLSITTMYNPIGLILKSPRKIGKLIDKSYQLTQEIIYQKQISKKIDDLIYKMSWDRIEYQHDREGENLN
jgi:hypothetical protein